MARFLSNVALWPETRKRAKDSRRLTVVSAYLGSHPESLLRWPHQSLIVADISEATVRRGICSAKGALRLREPTLPHSQDFALFDPQFVLRLR
jgi:hypothetical protein